MQCERCGYEFSEGKENVCIDCIETVDQQIECLENCNDDFCPASRAFYCDRVMTCNSGFQWEWIPKKFSRKYFYWNCEKENTAECFKKWKTGHVCKNVGVLTYVTNKDLAYVLMLSQKKLIKNAYNFGAFLSI